MKTVLALVVCSIACFQIPGFRAHEPKSDSLALASYFTLQKEKYLFNEPVLLRFVLANKSKHSLTIGLPTALEILDSRLSLTLERDGQAAARRQLNCAGTVYPSRNLLHVIQPGGAIEIGLLLNSHFDLEPGDYVLQGRFSLSKLGTYRENGVLVNNVGTRLGEVRFSVVPVPVALLEKTENKLVASLRGGNIDQQGLLHLLSLHSENALRALTKSLSSAARTVSGRSYPIFRDSLYLNLCSMPNRELAVETAAELAKNASDADDRYLALAIVRSRGEKKDARLLRDLLDDKSPNIRWEALRCIEQLLGIDPSDGSSSLEQAPAPGHPLIRQAKMLLDEP